MKARRGAPRSGAGAEGRSVLRRGGGEPNPGVLLKPADFHPARLALMFMARSLPCSCVELLVYSSAAKGGGGLGSSAVKRTNEQGGGNPHREKAGKFEQISSPLLSCLRLCCQAKVPQSQPASRAPSLPPPHDHHPAEVSTESTRETSSARAAGGICSRKVQSNTKSSAGSRGFPPFATPQNTRARARTLQNA